MNRALTTLLLAAILAPSACSQAAPQAKAPPASPAPSPRAAATPSATPAPVPTPALPAYYVESLRARAYPGGQLQVQDEMFRGSGFTKYHMSWPSGGQTMTGTISIPAGNGPFPVVVVNHGYIPADRYWTGQDSGIFGDPLAAHGFISVAPNWPGYSGSGPGPPDLPAIGGELVAALDLVSSLQTFAKADPSKVAFIGHSNGGGISLLAMAVDPRVKAVVLFAPVSSDMADNARKWWLNNHSMGPMGTPDTNPEGYAHFSPRNYFASGQPPVLFLQGTADEDIPASWTNASHDAIAAKGIDTQVVWFPGAHHDMVGSDLDRANSLSEDWIRKALGMPVSGG
ncbi:MAG TPA: alpha/beta fold hydrolase [Candidatus Dormibacteraeota bacterium]